jgi:AraC family transcriptional regulator, melibiose operon regulatory protein
VNEGVAQMANITRFIARNYRDPLTVQTIADHAGLHAKYLMRVFKKQCGSSVWEYLTRLRVSHAQRLLITSDMKVLDVAMESGFSSVAPFYAAFAAHTRGLRPLDYRRQHRPAGN